MPAQESSSPERRDALLRTVRRVVGETGVDGLARLDPVLAARVAAGLAADVAAAVDRRTAGVRTLDELVDGLVDAVIEGAEPWREALSLAHVALEQTHDFQRWAALVAPWLEAVERAVTAAQHRGLVRPDVDPTATALVLRDTLDHTAKVAVRFQREGHREAAVALVRAALRA